MVAIEAIETKYKGYNFRSRLEARWAVFFDTLGVKWEYEAEGYDLGKEGWYLPDFYVFDWKMHVEIKPKEPEEGYWRKPQAFAIGTRKNLLLICGRPCRHEYDATLYDARTEVSGPGIDLEFMECKDCTGIKLVSTTYYEIVSIDKHTCKGCGKRSYDPGRVMDAYHAAGAMRFNGRVGI